MRSGIPGILPIIYLFTTIFLCIKVRTLQHNLDYAIFQIHDIQDGKYISSLSIQKIEQKMSTFEKKVMKLEKALNSCLECGVDKEIRKSYTDLNERQVSSSRLKTPYKIQSFSKSMLDNEGNINKSNLVNRNNDIKERKLQVNDTSSVIKNNIVLPKRICEQKPLLLPFNHINNYKYDDKVKQILYLVNAITSPDLLVRYDSPQYKAACYLMFEDMYENMIKVDLLAERYVILVLLYSTHWYDEIVFPSNTCDFVGIECDSVSRNIIGIEWGK